MILDRVTMTGADDSIKPWQLIRPSLKYSYVEWGLLVSTGHNGDPRWPTMEWMREYFAIQQEFKLHTSLHFCGKVLRTLMMGEEFYAEKLGAFLPHVERVQLNFHGGEIKYDGPKFIGQLRRPSLKHIEWIFQIEGVNDVLYHLAVQEGVKAVPLFDMSHGAGVLPQTWPDPIANRCGYAGGLGSDCLTTQLQRLAIVGGDRCCWVDMETKLRSNDDKVFILCEVDQCLEQAKPWTRRIND